jgi:hypothetical protein
MTPTEYTFCEGFMDSLEKAKMVTKVPSDSEPPPLEID